MKYDENKVSHRVGLLLIAPFLGLTYAAFLPLIGIVIALSLVLSKVLGKELSFNYQLLYSNLIGRKFAKKTTSKEV